MPKIEMNMPEPPEGWEYTGEFRYVESGERGLCANLSMIDGQTCNRYPILRRVHQWPQWLIDSPFEWVTVDVEGPKVWLDKPTRDRALGMWTHGRRINLCIDLPSDARGESAIWQIPKSTDSC